MPVTRKSWTVAAWVHAIGSFFPSRTAERARSTASFSATSAVRRLPEYTRSVTLPPSLVNPCISIDTDWVMIENVQVKRAFSANLTASIFWGNTSIVYRVPRGIARAGLNSRVRWSAQTQAPSAFGESTAMPVAALSPAASAGATSSTKRTRIRAVVEIGPATWESTISGSAVVGYSCDSGPVPEVPHDARSITATTASPMSLKR